MSELKFTCVNNEEYNTVSINIENAFVIITEDDYEIIEKENNKFGSQKATIKLNNHELKEKLKSWETQINDYLKSEGIRPINILYGNMIYPKTKSLLFIEGKEEHRIKVKSIWINERKKPFVQLWYLQLMV